MDTILDLLISLGDAITLKGIISKKHRIIDYITIFVIMIAIMLVVIGKYNILSVTVSILFSLLVSIIFGSITNTIFKSNKNK